LGWATFWAIFTLTHLVTLLEMKEMILAFGTSNEAFPVKEPLLK
jgi:hypothetical protein